MIALTICVPRINDGGVDFMELAMIWRRVQQAGDGAEVIFDFLSCDFLQPNAVVFLGGLTRLIMQRGGSVRFRTDTMSGAVKANLFQNGFAHAMGALIPPWKGNSIPYREYAQQDKTGVTTDLRENWLGRDWLNISEALANELVGQMWEIFANAFEHGKSSVGVSSCGQYFKTKRELTLSVADFGVGIPSNVRIFLGQPELSGAEALRWAFQRGNSTAVGARGIGLDLLRDLVRQTGGSMCVYSHDSNVHIDANGDKYDNPPMYFAGTLVHIRLVCDDKRYILSAEATQANAGPFF